MLSPQTCLEVEGFALLTCGTRFLLLPLSQHRLLKLWRSRTGSNIPAWHLERAAALPWGVQSLADHMHLLLCVSYLGSKSITPDLDAQRGWCFIFLPCSSAAPFCCFLFDKGTCYLTLDVNGNVVSNDLPEMLSCPSSLQP